MILTRPKSLTLILSRKSTSNLQTRRKVQGIILKRQKSNRSLFRQKKSLAHFLKGNPLEMIFIKSKLFLKFHIHIAYAIFSEDSFLFANRHIEYEYFKTHLWNHRGNPNRKNTFTKNEANGDDDLVGFMAYQYI